MNENFTGRKALEPLDENKLKKMVERFHSGKSIPPHNLAPQKVIRKFRNSNARKENLFPQNFDLLITSSCKILSKKVLRPGLRPVEVNSRAFSSRRFHLVDKSCYSF